MDTDYKRTIGKSLELWMKEKGYNQKQLSTILQCDRTSIYHITKGHTLPTRIAPRFQACFGVNIFLLPKLYECNNKR